MMKLPGLGYQSHNFRLSSLMKQLNSEHEGFDENELTIQEDIITSAIDFIYY